MTDKELSKLRRTELLEMLIAQGKEYAKLQQQLTKAEEALQSRELAIQEAGTLAEASCKLNDMFGAAQRAIDLYTENVNRLRARQEEESNQALAEAKAYAEQTVTDADERAQWLLTAARDQAAHILEEAHAEAKKLTSTASDNAAQIRADAQKEKEALLQQAHKDAEIIRKAARSEAGVPETEPVEEDTEKKRPFWKRDK